MQADILIRGAQVADGETPIRTGDVAISGAHIVAVGAGLPVEACGEIIDGDGVLVCPGFIDMHAHSALQPFVDARLMPKVAQGFTTELICPDGLGPAPVRRSEREARRRYLAALEGAGPPEWPWESIADYLTALQEARPATSLVTSVAHSAIRDVVIGSAARQPDEEELQRMQDEVRAGLAAGARVLSFGLIYAPGLYADAAELAALAKVAARHGAPLMPHVRNEGSGVLAAIREFVQIAEHTGAPLHISHLKLVGSAYLLEDLLAAITDAASRIDLTYDQYPYGAGNTLLSALLPPWALDGGPSAMLHRLRQRADRLRILRDMERGIPGWENLYGACGPTNITITDAAAPRSHDIGKTVEQISAQHGTEPASAVLDLLADTDLNVGMIDHYASEQVVKTIFRLPAGLVGSDGIFSAHPHPRLFATAAKVLGRYAQRERLVSVEEAVSRLTARAADRLGLDDRGRIKAGLRADLVLLDPDRFIDTATYEHPCQPPPGVHRVLIAGRTVYQHGRHADERPGTVIRTQRSA